MDICKAYSNCGPLEAVSSTSVPRHAHDAENVWVCGILRSTYPGLCDNGSTVTEHTDKSEPRDVAVQQQEEKNLGETYTYAQYSTHNPIAKQVLGPPLQKNFVRF